MTMAQQKGLKAKEYFMAGYNCSQSVAMAYADEMGLNETAVARMVSGFGGGMGRLREVCGAVTGAFTVLSILKGYDDPKDSDGKKQLYALIQNYATRFKEGNGSYVCADLLNAKKNAAPEPEERTNGYYEGRPCAELTRYAAEILYEYVYE